MQQLILTNQLIRLSDNGSGGALWGSNNNGQNRNAVPCCHTCPGATHSYMGPNNVFVIPSATQPLGGNFGNMGNLGNLGGMGGMGFNLFNLFNLFSGMGGNGANGAGMGFGVHLNGGGVPNVMNIPFPFNLFDGAAGGGLGMGGAQGFNTNGGSFSCQHCTHFNM